MCDRRAWQPSASNHGRSLPLEPVDDTLSECLAALIERVDRRVHQARGSYDQDSSHVRRAAQQVLNLRNELNLGRLVGPVGPERTKPQFLLLFERSNGDRVVLKVYGKTRPGEAVAQIAWRHHGVRVVDVLDAGDDPTSWLIMRAVETRPVALSGQLTRDQLTALTAELAEVLASAHAVGMQLLARDEVPLAGLQHLETAIKQHLAVAIQALQRHGYAPHRDWRTLTQALRAPESAALLHGDLVVGNVVRDAADHQLLLLDSCGYIGPPEFDAARWAARAGGAASGLIVLSSWLDVEPGLNSHLAHTLLALELVMEAGVRELVKEEQGEPWHAFDDLTHELLETADEILARRSQAVTLDPAAAREKHHE
jgi:Phosphotransferase enzyme family